MKKHVFQYYKVWERKLVSVCFIKKVRVSKQKLEIDDQKSPKKKTSFGSLWGRRSSCRICIYSWGVVPPNFYLSRNITLEGFRQWKYCFQSVVWRKFWSWTLAIPSLFSSDVDEFKLETQIKTLKNIVDEKQVGTKEGMKIILSLNASRKLLVSEVLSLVKLILLVPTTNAVSERSRSTLCIVKTYLRSSMT